MRSRTAYVMLFAALCAAVAYGGERRATSYLPDDMFLAVAFDVNHPGMKETTAAAFFREPEVVEAMKAIQPLIDRIVEAVKEEQENQEEVALVWEIFAQSEWAFGVGAPEGEKAEPNFMLALNVGDGDTAARRAVSAMIELEVQKKAVEGTVKRYAIGEAKVVAYEKKNGVTNFCADLGTAFLACGHEATLKKALDPAAPKFAAATERPWIGVRYDHTALMKGLGPKFDDEAKQILKVLGLGAVRTVETGVAPRGKRLVWTFEADLGGGEPAGLTKFLASGTPVDRKLLERVPKGAEMFLLTSLDYGDLWDSVWAMVESMDPAAVAEGREGMAWFNERLGIDVRKDILGSLGRGTLLVSASPTGFMGGWGAIVQRVKNPELLEQKIAQVATRLDLLLMEAGPRRGPFGGGGVRTQLKPFTYRGHACKYLWVMGWPALMMPGWAPCYANMGDEFVFAMHPLHLKGYIDSIEDKGPNILENAEFQDLIKTVPASASTVSYGRLTELIVGLYNTAAPILMLFQGFGEEMGLEAAPDLANLPSAGLMRRYSQGAISYAAFEKGTYRIEVAGNGAEFLGPHIVPVGVTAMMGAILVPSLARSRDQARRIQDRNKLNHIAKASATYLNEHGDNRFFPKSMAEMVEKGILGKGDLVSARDDAPPVINGFPCSFVSVFEKYADLQFRDDFPPNIIMAWDRKSFGPRGFRTVLFFDSHSEWVSAARFEQLFQELDRQVRGPNGPKPRKGLKGGEL